MTNGWCLVMRSARCLLRIGVLSFRIRGLTQVNFPPCTEEYEMSPDILRKKPYKIKKGTKWAPKGSPNGHKSSQRLPKGTQGLPKGSPKVPKWAQGGPEGSQEGPMGVPRAPQGVPRGPQGSPPGSKTSPRGAPGERSWNLLLGVPKKKHQNTAK